MAQDMFVLPCVVCTQHRRLSKRSSACFEWGAEENANERHTVCTGLSVLCSKSSVTEVCFFSKIETSVISSSCSLCGWMCVHSALTLLLDSPHTTGSNPKDIRFITVTCSAVKAGLWGSSPGPPIQKNEPPNAAGLN